MTLTVCGIRSPLLLESSEQSDGRLRRLRPRDVSTTRQRGPCFGKLRLSWGIRPLMPPHEKLSAETEEEEVKKELEELPLKIEQWEEEQEKLYQETASPEFYQQKPEEIVKTQKRLEQITEDLEKAYLRWEELDELAAN